MYQEYKASDSTITLVKVLKIIAQMTLYGINKLKNKFACVDIRHTYLSSNIIHRAIINFPIFGIGIHSIHEL